MTIKAGDSSKGTATWKECANADVADLQSLLTGSVCVEKDGTLTFNLNGKSKFSAASQERPDEHVERNFSATVDKEGLHLQCDLPLCPIECTLAGVVLKRGP